MAIGVRMAVCVRMALRVGIRLTILAAVSAAGRDVLLQVASETSHSLKAIQAQSSASPLPL